MRTDDIILAAVIGLDLTEATNAVLVAEVTKGIDNMQDFIEYCRNNKNSIEYQTKTERLDTLATNYKLIQEEAKLPTEDAKAFARNIAIKVEGVRLFVKNLLDKGEQTPFSKLRKPDGELFFSIKELRALALIGPPTLILDYAWKEILEEEIGKRYIEQYRKKISYNSITDKQKKVAALTAKLIK